MQAIAPPAYNWITEGNAYGSVVVLTMGQAPASLAEETGEKILWVRYLKAGGRIVSLGDLPFNYFQYPDPRPLPRALDDSGLAALGLRGGWDQPYWGRDLPVTKTPQAAAWGFESVDGSITGFPVESISTAFGTYTLPENGKLGASSWMKNLRADMPWSGLIKMCQRFDGVSDSDLRDVWRAANYVGKPVEIPPLPPPHRPPPAPDITVQLTASGISGRTEFCRGEDVAGVVSVVGNLAADRVRVELLDGTNVLTASDCRPDAHGKSEPVMGKFALATAPYRYGDYQLRIRALAGAKLVGEAVQAIGIRYVPPEGFCWQPWVGTSPNPRRREMVFADIQAAGMEPHLVDLKVEGMDAILRRNMGFSLRLCPDLAGGKQYTWEKNRDFFRLDIQGKPIPCAYAGGRPTLGISQGEILQNARRSMYEGLRAVARHPGLRPYVLCNDDFSIYYGWDFSEHVVKRFREQTGLAAPRKMIEPPPGPVDDNHPWLRWCEFTLDGVCGAMILSGGLDRYRVVLLCNVGWLRRSVCDALIAHIARGGTVLLDNTVCFDLPGARRVNIDLGLGRTQAAATASKTPHGSTPGIADYGDPERIGAIRKALAPHVRPRFECPDIRLVANRFEIGGVPYTWFVNAHTGKEYMFCRERMGAGHPGAGTPEKVAELIAWEKAQTAAGPFCARVAADSLSGVPYDLVLGRPIPVENVDGRPSFIVMMDRFGGSLVAFYPEAIDHVALRLPATARLLEEVAATIEVHGRRAAIPGAVPTEVTLRDPAGKTSVLSGVRATDRGMLVFSWTPAVNDLKGTWTIEAVELASGKTARGSVLIGP